MRKYWWGRFVLYRAYDVDGRLLYVGRSVDVVRRISEHRSQSWWWKPLVARLRLQVLRDELALKAAERQAIREEQPVFNAMGIKDWRSRPNWSESDRQLYVALYEERVNSYADMKLATKRRAITAVRQEYLP